MGGACEAGNGLDLAEKTLNSGQALAKFMEICEAQGGFKNPCVAPFQQIISAPKSGIVSAFNNRILSRLASLAGAPNAMTAGVDLHIKCGEQIKKGDPIMTLHAQAHGELQYALAYLNEHPDVILIGEDTGS